MKCRFHITEMGATAFTRWFEDYEILPSLDWQQVTAIETSQEMTVEQFKTKYPEIILPASMTVKPSR